MGNRKWDSNGQILNVYLLNEELIQRGNLIGKYGKRGLEKNIVDVIVGKTNNNKTKFFFNQFPM